MVNLKLFFGTSLLLLLLAACASSKSGDTTGEADKAAAPVTDCAKEIALTCSAGAQDGCLLPHPKDASRQLTTRHICVQSGDEQSSMPCEQEVAKVCNPGHQDACLVAPRPADVHVCVSTG